MSSKATISTQDYENNHGKLPSKRQAALWAFEITYEDGTKEITYVSGRWHVIADALAAVKAIVKVEVLG